MAGLRPRLWLGWKLSAVTHFFLWTFWHPRGRRNHLLCTESLTITCEDLMSCSYVFKDVSKTLNLSSDAVSPAIVEVKLRRKASGLGNRALLCSGWCRLGGCWCRRSTHRLVSVSCSLAGLDRCLTRLSRRLARLSSHLAWLGASLAWLGYRTGLGLWAVFLGHGALFLWAGPRLGSCDGKKVETKFYSSKKVVSSKTWKIERIFKRRKYV